MRHRLGVGSFESVRCLHGGSTLAWLQQRTSESNLGMDVRSNKALPVHNINFGNLKASVAPWGAFMPLVPDTLCGISRISASRDCQAACSAHVLTHPALDAA